MCNNLPPSQRQHVRRWLYVLLSSLLVKINCGVPYSWCTKSRFSILSRPSLLDVDAINTWSTDATNAAVCIDRPRAIYAEMPLCHTSVEMLLTTGDACKGVRCLPIFSLSNLIVGTNRKAYLLHASFALKDCRCRWSSIGFAGIRQLMSEYYILMIIGITDFQWSRDIVWRL